MPTSPSRASEVGEARGDLGLTLVEMLVVLAIVGVMAGAVVLAMGPAGRGGSEGEARRLAARLSLAADEAMVTDRVIGFQWTRDGYRFVDWQGGRWVPDPAPALEDYKLPGGLRFDDGRVDPVVVGADGGGTPLALHLGRGDGARGWSVRFDGADARVAPGA